MDLLLKDYGSDSDGEEEEEDNKQEVPAAPPLVETATTTTTTTHTDAATAEQQQQQQQRRRRHGQKLLSLQAIVPPHIFQQLTAAAQAGSDDDDDDDDDDDEDPRKLVPQRSSTTTSSSRSKDPGLSRLLHALHNTKQSQNQQQQQPQRQQQSMGSAFLSSTTTITSKKEALAVVRDIHAPPVAVETGRDETSNDKDNDDTMTRELPISATRPRVVQAAPRTSVPQTPVNSPKVAAAATTKTITESSVPPPHPPASQSNKRSRKELERLLRQGQLDQVLQPNPHGTSSFTSSLSDLIHVDAHDHHTNDFEPEPEVVVPTHGVRNVPTQMYDPSLGSTVVAAAGSFKGRGKNQIGHLVAQAAHLELARARAGQQQGGGGNIHRANAKRKYGW